MTFIKSIINDSNKILLKKYGPPLPELLITDQSIIRIAFVDTETTGIDRINDKIIEIAIKVVSFEKSSGKILSIEGQYESFNDPEIYISEEISLITRIDNNMVKGKKIDWNRVDNLLNDIDLIVAHNARFDRAFVDRFSTFSSTKIWACSVRDINWLKRGFSSSKQELLCYWHGFYFDAHRAMNDIDALINLLTFDSGLERPLLELIKNSNMIQYVIFAENFKYDPHKKDLVKNNKYNWNPEKKLWYKIVNLDQLNYEKDWLKSTIYDERFEGRVEEINPKDKYKI